jgi:hypothetical protein
VARYVPEETGPHRVSVAVTAPDGSDVGSGANGWTADPARLEFENLEPRKDWLEELAEQTGGEMIAPTRLANFVADLPNRKNVVTEPWTYPFWHQWWFLAFIITCLASEWALRRWKGLA